MLVNADCVLKRQLRDPVGAREDQRAPIPAALPACGYAPDFVEVIDADTEDGAVGVGGHGDRGALGPRGRGRDEVLASVFDPLQRLPEVIAREDDDLFVAGEVRLLTEAAADVTHPHADLTLGNSRDASGDGADVVW